MSALLNGLMPALMMVVVQLAFAGLTVLYKLATNDGMDSEIIIAYRFIFAAALMIPLAFIVERKKRPKLTWRILYHAFICGLFGGLISHNMYVKCLVLTSATFSSAINNLVPAVTFVLSITFGLEKVGLRSGAGKAKVLGTIMGIGGAMVLTFYKGVEIHLSPYHINLLPHKNLHQHPSSNQQVLSLLLAMGFCLTYSSWLILQTKMSEKYPCQYSTTALVCSVAAILCTIYALCTVKDKTQWRLGWDIRLLISAYSGIVASGLSMTLISWCVRMRGPVFVSGFNPLLVLIVALASYFLLDEKLHLGSVLGSVLIVGGLYALLWGKHKEMKMKPKMMDPQSVEIVTSSIDGKSSNNGVDNPAARP